MRKLSRCLLTYGEKLGIREYLTLEINSLGNREERAAHRAALVEYLTRYEDKLDEDSKRRLKTNFARFGRKP